MKQKVSSRGKYVSVNIGPVQVVSSEQVFLSLSLLILYVVLVATIYLIVVFHGSEEIYIGHFLNKVLVNALFSSGAHLCFHLYCGKEYVKLMLSTNNISNSFLSDDKCDTIFIYIYISSAPFII